MIRAENGFWVDERNNKWTQDDVTEQQAALYSESLIGCINCTDCHHCTNCDGCIRCSHCHNCKDCKDCFYCAYCYACNDTALCDRSV